MIERVGRLGGVLLLMLGLSAASRAEMVDEIVAWVNGDIITRSDFEDEEKARMTELYRQLTGAELDEKVEEVRKSLLLQMVENKILVQRAHMMYDMTKMREGMFQDFKKRQGIEDDEELKRLLVNEGMTVETLKDRLVEMMAPDYVIQFEVTGRVAVGDREVDEFYRDNPDQFSLPAEVTIREIVVLAETPADKELRRTEMEALRTRALSGEDFEALARDHSESGTSKAGGLLAAAKRGELSPQLEAVAFTLGVGEISEVLEFPYGFHLIKIEQRLEDRLQDLEEIRERVRKGLEDRRFFKEYRAFMDKARGEAEWCVKPAFRDRLPIQSPDCQAL